MYRSYTRALADEMKHRSLDTTAYELAEDDAALQALLRSDDARDVRLGLDLLPGVVSPASAGALRHASEHEDPRFASGPSSSSPPPVTIRPARRRPRSPTTSPSPQIPPTGARRRALGPSARHRPAGTLIGLLDDPDPTVRAAALDAVVPDGRRRRGVVRRVVAALEEPRTAGSATAALRRLGDSAVPLIAAALARDGRPRRPPLLRAAADCSGRARRCGDRARAARPRPRGRARGALRAGCGGRRRRRAAGRSSTTCSTTPPRMPHAPSRRAMSLAGVRRLCCGGRWRTRATSHGDSSSPCSRFATATRPRRRAGRRPRRRPAPRTRSRGARRDHLPRRGRDRAARSFAAT